MVARFPSSIPALASVKAAVHKPPIFNPRRVSLRIQFKIGFVVVSLIFIPPQTIIVSSRCKSIRLLSTLKEVPAEHDTGLPSSLKNNQL